MPGPTGCGSLERRCSQTPISDVVKQGKGQSTDKGRARAAVDQRVLTVRDLQHKAQATDK